MFCQRAFLEQRKYVLMPTVQNILYVPSLFNYQNRVYILFFDLTRFFIMQKGFTLLLINLDNSTTIQVKVAFNRTSSSRHKHRFHRKHIRLPQGYKSENDREEYHLTAKNGNLHSQTMLLNGKILTVNSSGDIPPLEPVYANSSSPISVAPFSIVFAHIPNVVPPACR